MTARELCHRCRKAGIALAVDGNAILFDAPPGVAVPVDDLRACKAEMMALLSGDYLEAAHQLVLRSTERGAFRGVSKGCKQVSKRRATPQPVPNSCLTDGKGC